MTSFTGGVPLNLLFCSPTPTQGFAQVLRLMPERGGPVGPHRLVLTASTGPLVAGSWGLGLFDEPGTPCVLGKYHLHPPQSHPKGALLLVLPELHLFLIIEDDEAEPLRLNRNLLDRAHSPSAKGRTGPGHNSAFEPDFRELVLLGPSQENSMGTSKKP